MNAHDIIVSYHALRAARAPYEADWEEIARLMRPMAKGFASKIAPGQRRHKGIYHSGPLEAVENFIGGLYASLTPPSNIWHRVQDVDEDLNEYGPVKEYFELVSQRTWKSFGPGVSRFYNNVPSVYGSLGTFGTGIIYSAEVEGEQRFVDRARGLAECYIDVDHEDQPDTLYRVFRMTAKAIVGNPAWSAPPRVAMAAAKPESASQLFTIIHAVWPVSKAEARRNNNKRWRESYVVEEEKLALSRDDSAGYFEFPYMCPRWAVAEGEIYGRGLGHVALADVKSLQITRRSNLNMMDRAGRPTILAHSELDVGGGALAFPGETVYGAINSDGKKLLSIMDEAKNPAVSIEMEKMLNDAVKDAFKFGIMQIVGSYSMTATEWVGRADEQQRLLGPNLANSEVELLSPLVKRRVGMLERVGQLPPPPRELMEYGGGIEVKYIGLAARLARLKDGEAAVKAVAALGNAMAVAPEVADAVDPDDLAEAIAEGFGSNFLRTREARQQIRDAREQQAQMKQMAEMAPGAAGAAKDMAQATQIAKGGQRATTH